MPWNTSGCSSATSSGTGRDFRRALRQPKAVPLLSIHGQQDQLVPLAAMAAAEEWVDARHDLISLPGVGHLPHEEDPAAVTRPSSTGSPLFDHQPQELGSAE